MHPLQQDTSPAHVAQSNPPLPALRMLCAQAQKELVAQPSGPWSSPSRGGSGQ